MVSAKICTLQRFFFKKKLTWQFIDPYSPWSTKTDSFRVNNISHRKFAVTSNDHPYEVVVSTNPQQSHLVDMDVIDAKTKESIKTFTGVESHLDSEGLMVSSIDNKTIKSNVVLHDEDVVVFDEVRLERHVHRKTKFN